MLVPSSIPNCASKNVIDILMITSPLPTLISHYIFKAQYNVVGRSFFSKKTEVYEVHLHVITLKYFGNLLLIFRQYLLDNPGVIDEYVQLKTKLASCDNALDKSANAICFKLHSLQKYFWFVHPTTKQEQEYALELLAAKNDCVVLYKGVIAAYKITSSMF